jgi:hypothetical protein
MGMQATLRRLEMASYTDGYKRLVESTSEDFDEKELGMGIETELEHTSDKKTAEKIAKDHLRENPKYYSILKKCMPVK